MHKDLWLLIDNTPTRLLTWGSDFEQLQEHQHVVFMIPGNPGIADFYSEFLTKLHEEVKIPICMVSHAGHDVPVSGWLLEQMKQEKFDECRMYDLKQQVDHKVKIIEKLIPKHCKLHIIAHSMGAKVTLDLLKTSLAAKRIERCYLLFPTIEHIGDTPNAQFIKPFIRYFASVVIFLSWVFTLLPCFVKTFLLRSIFWLTHGGSNQCTINGGMKLIQPSVLKNVFHLTKDEMKEIKELDLETLRKFKIKLKFYYGTNDGWSPLEFYHHLLQEIPEIDAEVCSKGIKHAFTIDSAVVMSSVISNWIKTSLYP